MKTTLLTLTSLVLLSVLSGCVAVHDNDEDEAVSTTTTTRRSTTVGVPASTATVERTTVY